MTLAWPWLSFVVGAVAGCGHLARPMVQRWKEEVRLG